MNSSSSFVILSPLSSIAAIPEFCVCRLACLCGDVCVFGSDACVVLVSF